MSLPNPKRASKIVYGAQAHDFRSTTPTPFSAVTATTRSKLSSKDEIKWQELLSRMSTFRPYSSDESSDQTDFRSVQSRHEKARRQLHSGELGSMSSIHYSSPSQTYNSVPPTAGLQSAVLIPPKSATLKKKSTIVGRISSDSGGRISSMSPLNPKRGGGHTRDSASSGAGLILAGGAVASMNSNQGLGGMRAGSPPLTAGRKKILGGIRKSGPG